MLDQLETLARTGLLTGKFILSSGHIGRGFHYTRKGPGRTHNHTGIEKQLKIVEAKLQFALRTLLNRWPTNVTKFYDRFGFCPVTVPVFEY